jgi:phosphohistidine phosphatase
MSTTVLLIRHAKPSKSSVESDFLRPLSEEGKIIQHKMNEYLRYRGLIPDAIWHSPFKRTQETAEIIGQDFGVTPLMELSLGEYLDEEDLLEKLPDPKEKLCIYLVGHGPQLMRLATFFVGTPVYSISPSPSSALQLEFHENIAPGKAYCIKFFSPEVDLPK